MTTMTKAKKPRTATRAVAPSKAAKAVIQVRVDAKTKDKAEKFFKRHGVSTGDGMRLLINQAMAEDALPHIPNAETQKAMEDVLAGQTEHVSLSELKTRLLGAQ